MPNRQPAAQTPDAASILEGLWITDELLFHHQRCRRRAYLDLYSDPGLRDRPSDYLMKLRQDSIAHQANVLAEEPAHHPTYPRQDWIAGAQATLALMEQGVDRIAQGVLWVPLENGVHLVTRPNLLVKHPGHSIFGDWIYVPLDIRLGKRPKMDYQVMAAYHAHVLAAVQGAWPENSWLILRQRGTYAVDLVELLPRMEEILTDCIQTLQQPEEPEVFIAHNRCDLCPWLSHCYSVAKETNHLSLLPGVTPTRYVHLKTHQLTTVESLATTPVHRLETLPGFGAQVAHRIVQQAQATLHNRALPHFEHYLSEPPLYLLADHELPTAPVELYFDIEAAPEHNLIYLHGVLVVDRQAQTEVFYPLLAERHEEERVIWEQFLDLVWQYPDAPIFHFCPYELQAVRKMAEYYGTPSHRIEPLVRRFVDLHERVTRVAILPVESYALKPIARWIGFDWRDAEANGAQSICWYSQWLETGDRTHLEAILRYNEDDCRATYWVKDWLVAFNQGEFR
ncbi:MAG: TM0106 family RecB-like putative nuclease [Oculatellaceae cyanobacterium Prado106]|nr:TM0106 family RecB-like putative nuclease [Oculatellaceae cyanobacterium Prado106]